MSNKKSFILHIDSLDVIDDLSDQQCAELFRAIKAHHKNENFKLSAIVKIAFSPFKNQFIRDLDKYEKASKVNSDNGRKGGKRTQANARKCKRPKANQADSVNDNDNDNDNDNVNDNDNDNDNVNDNVNDNDNDNVNDNVNDSEKDSKNKKGNGKDKDISITKNIDGLDYKAFNKYIAYRKEAGIKKLTKHGEELTAKKLVSIGGNKQMEVVEQSIGNGWSGLFELKGRADNKTQSKIDDFNEWIDSGNNVIEGECDVIN